MGEDSEDDVETTSVGEKGHQVDHSFDTNGDRKVDLNRSLLSIVIVHQA